MNKLVYASGHYIKSDFETRYRMCKYCIRFLWDMHEAVAHRCADEKHQRGLG